MDFKWMLVAAILGIVGALPMKSHMDPEELMEILQSKELGRNNAIETLIINAMEDFRQIMVTGSDDIPVLDPFHVEHIYLDDNVIPIPGAHIEFQALVVDKLSTFELNEVSVESTSVIPPRYSILIEGEIPVIDVDVGHYDLLINFWGFDIFGTGDGKVTVVKPWLKIDGNVNLRAGFLTLNLNIMDLRLEFGLSDIQFGITGMFGDPSVDDFVNRFLRNIILEFAEFWMDEISDVISPIVKDVANEVLSDINLIGILG